MLNIINQIKTLIRYRYLLWNLAIRDIKVKYRTPILGFLWAIINPLIMVLVYKFVFSKIFNMTMEEYPVFIYVMTAIFPWMYFSSSINDAINSISGNRELIKKTRFSREIIPVSVVLANLLNFLPAFIIMLLFLIFFKMQFTVLILLLPLIILLQTILTIGLALIVSSLQIIMPDLKYIVELSLMACFFLSPAFYTLKMVTSFSEEAFKVYTLNPFVGLFCFYRIAFLEGYTKTLPAQVNMLGLSIWTITVCIAVFFIGFFVFKKYEPRFPDLI